jgi:hypothetical protein
MPGWLPATSPSARTGDASHRRLDLRPSGYGSRNHPRTKAVVVLTILLIIIVLLLLFGGWGYSRRGRRI